MLGAARWLATLGPVAEGALASIDSCADDKFDAYVNDQMVENWLVRFQSAQALTALADVMRQAQNCVSQLRDELLPLLRDESCDVVGISGEFLHDDQIYQWRRERRSVTAAAIRALFALEAPVETKDLFVN